METETPPAKLNISRAARAADVSRTTIQKYVKTGKLSAERGPDGLPLIQVGELIRVFGELKDPGEPVQRAVQPAAAPHDVPLSQQIEVLSLKNEVNMLRRELDSKKEVMGAKEQLVDQLRNNVQQLEGQLQVATQREQQLLERERLLLEHKPDAPLPHRSWWRFWVPSSSSSPS